MEQIRSTSRKKEVNPEDQYIIGIGASAGGLEAINELFDNMPPTTGFSFIVVQHLSPDHKSLMGELLSKHTQMQVYEAEDGMEPKPDCVYLIPARKSMTIEAGKFRLKDKVRDHQPNNAIDVFFESLAIEKRERAAGIILSGTGSDGTKGIQAIKNNGGTVIVQDPITAQFDGMPNSAVSSGYVDLILSPDMIGEELLEYIKEAPLVRSFNSLSLQEETDLVEILELVYKTTGHDFSNYKRPTINRRLAKRMAEHNIRNISDYHRHLEKNIEEIRNLCKEFLLHVTEFFRDKEAFEQLRNIVIPDLISKRNPGDVVKVWCVACSTGEEVYSIAMLFDECIEELNKTGIDLKIFASDISQDVIEIASKGVYTESQLKNVSPERLRRFFTKDAGGYKVSAALRKLIVFAKHDISKDPPFGKIDLLTCRNMLIYMNPLLQKNILQKMHFALNDDGYLFLGVSENIGILKDVMSEVDKKWKIYKCVSKSKLADFESFSNPERIMTSGGIHGKAKNALNHLADIFKETLLEEYEYAGIFIDRDFEVKQAVGNFKKFLEFPEGSLNFNLLKMVTPDLAIVLSTGIRKAMKENIPVVQKKVKVNMGKVERNVTVVIKPYLMQKIYLQPFLFIVLKEEEVQQKVYKPSVSREDYTDQRIDELEQELKDTKENLQALIEEVESANEELQSSNEEIVSANEELQSTNEELQSLNEELHTVNAEHQMKIKELIELNDDLNNYFLNTDIGQILIDSKLIIRKFTPIVAKQVNLIPTDIGRSITDIRTNIRNLDFINDLKSVLKSGKVLEQEVTVGDGKTYLMRIAPYLRQNKAADGAVVNFIDITEVKKLNTILQTVFDATTSGIVALNAIRDENNGISDFEFISANKASQELLGLPFGLMHHTFKEVYPHIDPKVLQLYKEVMETGKSASFEHFNEKSKRWFEVVVVKMLDGLLITFNDIHVRKTATEQIASGFEALKKASHELEQTNYKLEQSNLDLMQFASVASHDLKEPLRKIQTFSNMLKDKADGKLNPDEKMYVDKVIVSSQRMQALIDDIPTLSRLSKNDTPHTEIDLNQVVQQIVDDLEISIKEKDAIINIQRLPVVRGIAGQMHQLFQNLISNGIKFNEGKPVITITEQVITPEMAKQMKVSPKKFAAICFEDNGIGFEEQYSKKIFGIFQRLDKTNYEGTGIGLAIVKKIIENHNGYIKVESELGKGSKFVVVLPK